MSTAMSGTGNQDSLKDAASPSDLGRRKFMLAAGWGVVGVTLAGSTYAAYKFMFPPILYEPPTVFKIGHVTEYGLGVDERWKLKGRFWVVRNMRGIYNMISICRHLGCTPNWFPDQKDFVAHVTGRFTTYTGMFVAVRLREHSGEARSQRILWTELSLSTRLSGWTRIRRRHRRVCGSRKK